jgi:hypothetical protein
MGLVYDSRDSEAMMAALSANLATAASVVGDAEIASERLLNALRAGELSGQGYSAIDTVFAQAVVPSLQSTIGQLDSLRSDLEKYRWADSKVSRFGVLREDQLTVQLTATKAQRDATERLIEVNNTAGGALGGTPVVREALQEANRRLEIVLRQLENDVRELEDRLHALHEFDAVTTGLFENGLVETAPGRRPARGARTGRQQNGGIRPASLTVPVPTAGASAQQIAQWLMSGGYSIGALVAVCGGPAVMAAIVLITMNGSTNGSRFYTPEEQVRRARLEMYYWTHNLDGTVKKRIRPVPSPFGTYFDESPTFEDVDAILKEKTRKGASPKVREVDSPQEVRGIYEEITTGSEPVEDVGSYKGEKRRLPDGTEIGVRDESKSGGVTIDITSPKGTRVKVHLPKGWGK